MTRWPQCIAHVWLERRFLATILHGSALVDAGVRMNLASHMGCAVARANAREVVANTHEPVLVLVR